MKRRYLFALAVLPVTVAGAAFSRACTPVLSINADNSDLITYDYSKTNNTGIIKGGDVLKAVKGKDNVTPLPAEVAYADSHFQVKYDTFPSEQEKFRFGTIVNEMGSNYYIEGFKFDDFEPDHVDYTLGGFKKTAQFNDDETKTKYQYIAKVPTEAENINVVYKHTVKLDVNAANEIANAAYKVGVKEIEIQAAYDQYTNKLNAYNNYEAELKKFKTYETAHSEWTAKNENYQKYLTQKTQYDAKLSEYNNYINELNSYETKLESYKTYKSQLDAYNSNKAAIETALAQYTKKMSQVDYQLGIMDLFYLGPDAFPGVENGGTLYSYIYRNAVQTVINRKDELSKATGLGTAIDKAGEATIALRSLLDSYKTLRNSKNKEDMYKFYIKNYTKIKSNLITLAQCLEKFFSNNLVRSLMEQEGKTERYIFLIAELIYVSERMSDTTVYCYDKVYGGGGSSYKLDHNLVIEGKTVQQILGLPSIPEKPYTTKPLTSYPVSVEEIYGKKPEPQDFGLINDQPPVMPEAKEKPIAPQVVAAPGAEPVPAQFGAPAIRPTKPADPGVEPAKRNQEYNSLYELVKNEDLVYFNDYEETDGPIVLTVYEQFGLKTSGVNEQNIALYLDLSVSGKVSIFEVVYFVNGQVPTYSHDPEVVENEGMYQWLDKWEIDGVSYDIGSLFNGSATIEGFFGIGAEELEIFKVKWVDEEGNNILADNKLTDAYGMFRPAFYEDESRTEITPCKASTSTVRYDFEGIEYKDANGETKTVKTVADLPKVKENGLANFNIVDGTITITVKFKEVSLISVKFVMDGPQGLITLFDIGTVEENTRINYGGATPTKATTETARYEFNGWFVNGAKINAFPYKVTKPETGNEVLIKAEFKEIKLHKITFNYGDGLNETQIIEDGKKPVVPTNLDKQFTDNKFFEFDRWNSVISAAHSDMTYTAVYSEKDIIKNATITRDGNLKITVNNGVDQIDVSKFVELLGEGYASAPTTIEFSKATIELTEANVKQLASYGVAQIKIVNNVLEDGQREVEVQMLDKNGSPIMSKISTKVLLHSIEDLAHTKAKDSNGQINFEVVGTNDIKIDMVSNNKVTIGIYYTISFDNLSNCTYKVNGENKPLLSTVELLKGQDVEIEAIAKDGFTITKVIALNPDNTTHAQEEGTSTSFELNGDVKIYSNSELKVCTIRILVDNQVNFEITASYGAKIPLPTPYKRPENGTTYTFEGWKDIEGNLTNIIVTGDTDLVAVFSETKDETNSVANQASSITRMAGIILLVVSLVGFTTGFVIVLVKKPKEKE